MMVCEAVVARGRGSGFTIFPPPRAAAITETSAVTPGIDQSATAVVDRFSFSFAEIALMQEALRHFAN